MYTLSPVMRERFGEFTVVVPVALKHAPRHTALILLPIFPPALVAPYPRANIMLFGLLRHEQQIMPPEFSLPDDRHRI